LAVRGSLHPESGLYELMYRLLVCIVVLLAVGTLTASTAAAQARPLQEQYREPSRRLITAALEDEEGWSKLAYLCDRIGHRLSGSVQLERAIEWAANQMKQDGLQNVVTPPVMVPHWVRGRENAAMLEPRVQALHMLGLGGSVSTPEEGITAELIAVSSFEELEALGGERIQDRIVLYDVPFTGYGPTVAYRVSGAIRAARLGARAVLIRSVTPVSLQTPHTGTVSYAAEVPRIPAAALSIEDSAMLHRLYKSGAKVVVKLAMEARTLPDAESANVIGEIPGSERPEEIVVIGGHLDSWDVGQGAHDDAAGCVIAMQAAALIQKLGLQPRRTLRVVLWTNEENGLAGARAYREWIGPAIEKHVAAIEIDSGAEKPVGFSLDFRPGERPDSEVLRDGVLSRAREIAGLLASIEADQVTPGGAGADIGPLTREGVPGFGQRTVGKHYFDWHHSAADTLDKVDVEDFRLNIAAAAVLAFVLADLPEPLTARE
jgi:carboxypeptidase Q